MRLDMNNPFRLSILICAVWCLIGWNIGHPSDGNESYSVFGWFSLKYGESLLVLFTYLLWSATKDLVTDARDTSKKELRAYVHIKSASIMNLSAGQTPVSQLVIHNYGKTPAYNLIVVCGMGYGEEFEVLPPAEPVNTTPLGTLAPGGTFVQTTSSLVAFTENHILALGSNLRTVFVYGSITYTDLNGQQRFTNFRTFKNGSVDLSHSALASSNMGNESS